MNNTVIGWGNDKQEYADFCLAAAKDENIFINFKRDERYRKILEHVSDELGQKYYELLTEEYKALIPQAFRVNDNLGNPYLMSVPEGNVSPSTLRYLKVLQDLDKSEISGNVVEIGAGYAGMGRLILFLAKNKRKIKSYTAIDLLGPSALQNTYNHDLVKFKSIDFRQMEQMKSDFVISNYAFSELSKEIQKDYLDKVIANAKHGYITYNPGAGWEMSYDELQERLSNTVFNLDFPMVNIGYPENRIITW